MFHSILERHRNHLLLVLTLDSWCGSHHSIVVPIFSLEITVKPVISGHLSYRHIYYLGIIWYIV